MKEQSIFKKLIGKTEDQKTISIDSNNEDKDYSEMNFKKLIEVANEYNIFSEEEQKDILSKLIQGIYTLPNHEDYKEFKKDFEPEDDDIQYILSTKITINGKCITYFSRNDHKKTMFITNILDLQELICDETYSKYFLKIKKEDLMCITKEKYEYIIKHMSSTFQL